MKDHEVLVVGAGPAGSSCARALKEEGVDVVVIEKEALPRYKMCSGILFGQTQVLLEEYFGGLPPKSVYCRPEVIKASNVKEWNRDKGFTEYPFEMPKDGRQFPRDYHNVWRNKFDFWLLEQSGAEYADNCSIQGFSEEGDKVRVDVSLSTDKAKENKTLSCSYLIGADGGNSKTRRLLDPSWVEQSLEAAGYQTYYRFSDSGSLKEGDFYVFFQPEICQTICCVHHKDDLLALCVGGFKGSNLKESIELFKVFLSENFNVVFGEKERVEGCVMRPGLPNLGSGRIILTGEAAGFMYLNGEGISAAIDSGFRAGKAVAKAIKEGGDALEIYEGSTIDLLQHAGLCMEKMNFFAVQP